MAYGPAATGDEEADLERRTEFFKQLDDVIANLPQRYRLRKIVLGDFNARLGHSSDFLPDTFWPFLGTLLPSDEQNASGLLLLDICQERHLKVANSFYTNPCGSWWRRRGDKEITLDHILVHDSMWDLVDNCAVDPARFPVKASKSVGSPRNHVRHDIPR